MYRYKIIILIIINTIIITLIIIMIIIPTIMINIIICNKIKIGIIIILIPLRLNIIFPPKFKHCLTDLDE